MPSSNRHDKSAKPRPPADPRKSKHEKEEELLREQSKTETEQHPYLDTEGGE